MYSQPRPGINMAQDVSLINYDPSLNYEDVNMDNYMRNNLMDNGPEEVMMANDDFDPQMQRDYSRDKLERTYNPREEVRKSGVDLNDYSMDFIMGEDIGILQQEYIADQRKRLTETQYFMNDSAKQVSIGQVAPMKDNENKYWSRDSALRLRQAFVEETVDTATRRQFRGFSKKKLGYNPNRQFAAEKAFNSYAADITATTQKMYTGKVKQMAAVFKAMDHLQFNEEEMVTILKAARCLKPKNNMDAHKLDTDLGDNGEDRIKNAFAKIRMAKPKRNSNGAQTDKDYDDSLERVAAVSNVINKRAQARSRVTARDESGILTEFDDTVDDPVSKVHQGQDRLAKFARTSQESDIPDDVIETAIKKARNESAKLSKFYHQVQNDDHEYDPNDDSITVTDPSTYVSKAKGNGRNLQHGDSIAPDDEVATSVRPKAFHKFDTQKIKTAVTFVGEHMDNVDGNDPVAFRKSVQDARRNEQHKVYEQSKLDSASALGQRSSHKLNAHLGQRANGYEAETAMTV